MLSTLFLLVNHMVKVIVYSSSSLLLMFCKSGILIFIFAENNYLGKTVYMPIPCWLKHLCSIRALVPVSFSLSLSLSLPLRLSLFQADFLECRGSLSSLSCPGFSDSFEKALCTFTPSRGHLRPLWTEQALCRGFIGFLHKPRNISLFLSPLLSYWLTPDHQVLVH